MSEMIKVILFSTNKSRIPVEDWIRIPDGALTVAGLIHIMDKIVEILLDFAPRRSSYGEELTLRISKEGKTVDTILCEGCYEKEILSALVKSLFEQQ